MKIFIIVHQRKVVLTASTQAIIIGTYASYYNADNIKIFIAHRKSSPFLGSMKIMPFSYLKCMQGYYLKIKCFEKHFYNCYDTAIA